MPTKAKIQNKNSGERPMPEVIEANRPIDKPINETPDRDYPEQSPQGNRPDILAHEDWKANQVDAETNKLVRDQGPRDYETQQREVSQ